MMCVIIKLFLKHPKYMDISFLAELLYFFQSVAATFVFLYSGDIIHINISTSVGVEPTNMACEPTRKLVYMDICSSGNLFVGLNMEFEIILVKDPSMFKPHRSYNVYFIMPSVSFISCLSPAALSGSSPWI